MTTFEKLAIRIKNDLDIEVVNLKRTHAGHWQRSAGAFVWISQMVGSPYDVGSTYTASTLLQSKGKLQIHKGEIIPQD